MPRLHVLGRRFCQLRGTPVGGASKGWPDPRLPHSLPLKLALSVPPTCVGPSLAEQVLEAPCRADTNASRGPLSEKEVNCTAVGFPWKQLRAPLLSPAGPLAALPRLADITPPVFSEPFTKLSWKRVALRASSAKNAAPFEELFLNIRTGESPGPLRSSTRRGNTVTKAQSGGHMSLGPGRPARPQPPGGERAPAAGRLPLPRLPGVRGSDITRPLSLPSSFPPQMTIISQ